MNFKLNFFRSSHFLSKESNRLFSEYHFKDVAFSFHLHFCPGFVLLWFNCCNILLSDLCKFNIPLLSCRFSSCFKLNFLPYHFAYSLHSSTDSQVKYVFEFKQNQKHSLPDPAFVPLLWVLQIELRDSPMYFKAIFLPAFRHHCGPMLLHSSSQNFRSLVLTIMSPSINSEAIPVISSYPGAFRIYYMHISFAHPLPSTFKCSVLDPAGVSLWCLKFLPKSYPKYSSMSLKSECLNIWRRRSRQQ